MHSALAIGEVCRAEGIEKHSVTAQNALTSFFRHTSTLSSAGRFKTDDKVLAALILSVLQIQAFQEEVLIRQPSIPEKSELHTMEMPIVKILSA